MERKKILIVDDEKDVVTALQFTLETEGYECITAYEGLEALKKAREKKPDLIILDVMMPNLDGFHVSKFLKFDGRYKHIPIIMLTARTQEKDKKLGEETGAKYYITKPFEMDDLVNKINNILKFP